MDTHDDIDMVPVRPEYPVGDPDAAPAPLLERVAVGRSTRFPSARVWFRAGVVRNLRGVLTALIAAWFYVPAALASAAVMALGGGIIAATYSGLAGDQSLPASVRDVPLFGDAAQNLLLRSSGIEAAVLGVIVGAALGFVLGLIWVFLGPFERSALDGVSTVLGAIILGVALGLAYTAYRVVFERRILHITGARRLSRREVTFILPIVERAARSLGMSSYPPVLIDDTPEVGAFAYTRHIVVNQGLLDEFNYDEEAIAAVLAHELVHWYHGDPLSAAFVRGAALPLYVVQAGAGWLHARARSSLLRFLVWLAFWPVFVTVRYLVVPMQAADSRLAEYRADEGAALAGHRVGMRRVLARFRRSFEGGRNGWVAAVCASHPPHELRLERLEEPGREYPLPDEEAPPLPLPVLLTGTSTLD